MLELALYPFLLSNNEYTNLLKTVAVQERLMGTTFFCKQHFTVLNLKNTKPINIS